MLNVRCPMFVVCCLLQLDHLAAGGGVKGFVAVVARSGRETDMPESGAPRGTPDSAAGAGVGAVAGGDAGDGEGANGAVAAGAGAGLAARGAVEAVLALAGAAGFATWDKAD